MGNDLEGEPMHRQLLLELCDDTARERWEGFGQPDRDRVIALYTHLALRAARGAGPLDRGQPQLEDGHDRRAADE